MRNKPPLSSPEITSQLRHEKPPIRPGGRGGASTPLTREPPEPRVRARLPPAIRLSSSSPSRAGSNRAPCPPSRPHLATSTLPDAIIQQHFLICQDEAARAPKKPPGLVGSPQGPKVQHVLFIIVYYCITMQWSLSLTDREDGRGEAQGVEGGSGALAQGARGGERGQPHDDLEARAGPGVGPPPQRPAARPGARRVAPRSHGEGGRRCLTSMLPSRSSCTRASPARSKRKRAIHSMISATL